MNVKVFIACHKECDVPADALYLPLFVGASGKKDIGFQRDDSGDNISAKNPLYCELTGLYWCWKNLEYDYLGLAHYRRFFTLRSKSYQKKHSKIASVLTAEECESLLLKYRVIVPKKRKYYIETIYDHYRHTMDGRQLDVCREILQERHPEYIQSFDRLMVSREAYIFNMFIMDKCLIDDYCSWLFPVLEELERRYDSSKLTDFEKRYIGRISERLFNVWLSYKIGNGELKKQDIFELPYLYLGEVNWWKKGTSFLKAKFLHRKYEKSF